jgi:hypothetical protein
MPGQIEQEIWDTITGEGVGGNSKPGPMRIIVRGVCHRDMFPERQNDKSVTFGLFTEQLF